MKRHEHLVEFDLPIEELEVYRPERVEAPDFDAFWDRTLREVAEHGLDAELNPLQTPVTTLDVYDVRFSGYGGDPICGWLLRDPRERAGGPCVVQFLGDGSGRGHALDHLDWSSVGYQTLVVETRGQGAGALEGTTADPHPSHPHVPGWLTQGIREPETYYYRRVFVDAVRAVELARTHPAIAAERVVVAGISQGGAIALAAAALCPVDAVVANVLFGCHFERARVALQRPRGRRDRPAARGDRVPRRRAGGRPARAADAQALRRGARRASLDPSSPSPGRRRRALLVRWTVRER